jgi:hypothetical protein
MAVALIAGRQWPDEIDVCSGEVGVLFGVSAGDSDGDCTACCNAENLFASAREERDLF